MKWRKQFVNIFISKILPRSISNVTIRDVSKENFKKGFGDSKKAYRIVKLEDSTGKRANMFFSGNDCLHLAHLKVNEVTVTFYHMVSL